MEYPIIDTLIPAYIQNEWTGLGEINGINIWDETWENGVIESSGNINKNVDRVTTTYIPVEENTTYSFHMSIFERGRAAFYDNDYNLIQYFADLPLRSTEVISVSDGYYFLFTVPNNAKFFRYTLNTRYGSVYLNDVSVNIPSTYHGYISSNESNIIRNYVSNRFKLPMIRNTPHSLIDSLQHASDGTMTTDDVQVLRHYLSRFGIGNIELGRFHAINPNMEENRTLEFEDSPIEEIKKKGDD